MSSQPAVDLHAHVAVDIDPAELARLGVVFAATRSLDEAASAVSRQDVRAIWGVGCHPGLARAQRAFDQRRFSDLIARSAYVSEVGLDGESRVPMSTQKDTLDAMLDILAQAPRITSLHSYQATEQVVASLEARPIKGAVLHWWLGDEEQTRRALDLGCFFSLNASSVGRTDLLDLIPLDRTLTETDHPFGDRTTGREARPGLVTGVERALARQHHTAPSVIRSHVWRNLARLVGGTGCAGLLPPAVRRELLAS